MTGKIRLPMESSMDIFQILINYRKTIIIRTLFMSSYNLSQHDPSAASCCLGLTFKTFGALPPEIYIACTTFTPALATSCCLLFTPQQSRTVTLPITGTRFVDTS